VVIAPCHEAWTILYLHCTVASEGQHSLPQPVPAHASRSTRYETSEAGINVPAAREVSIVCSGASRSDARRTTAPDQTAANG
jgi:hypothetical protein